MHPIYIVAFSCLAFFAGMYFSPEPPKMLEQKCTEIKFPDQVDRAYSKALDSCVDSGMTDYECVRYMSGGYIQPKPTPTPSPKRTLKYYYDEEDT